MHSNPLEDEDRFRMSIDEAIKAGEVEGYDAYINEPENKKRRRHEKAAREGAEAEEYAKELGVHEDLFGSRKGRAKKGAKADGEAGLADLIQQRQKGRAANFLDDLEAKYGGGKQSKKGTGKKRKDMEEPPEEMFERNRQKKHKAPKAQPDDNDDEAQVCLEDESHDSVGISDEGRTKPKQKNSKQRKGATNRTRARK